MTDHTPDNRSQARPGRNGSDMEAEHGRIPPGPQEEYRVSDDLLDWMSRQFGIFGDIFKASIYGTSVYAVRDPQYAQHVLRENWQNYVKGQVIKRVALLLGNGLMVSKGDIWKRQRRMIQPTFNHDSIERWAEMISAVNTKLLGKWELAAQRNESVNVTRDVSSTALEVVLRFILGDDYEHVGFRFDLLSQERARNMEFAMSFRALGKTILQVIERRREESATSTDALGMLMRARDHESGRFMQNGQLVDEILTLIVAGHETTASTLNWAWYLISQHPEVEERLANELRSLPGDRFPELEDLPKFPYARQILEECLRL